MEAEMARRYWITCLLTVLLALSLTGTPAVAQSGAKPVMPPPQTDNSRFESVTTYTSDSFILYGNVTLPDGLPPTQLVLVERVCKGMIQVGGFADSKGRFSFDLGVLNRSLGERSIVDNQSNNQLAAKQINPEDLATCEVRASLSGYRSRSLSLAAAAKSQKAQLGTIVLMPLAKEETPAVSVNDEPAPKNARQAYEKGVDAAAKAKWVEAIKYFEKATSLYPQYSTAWLSLGILQRASNNAGAALLSFAHAIEADDQFALPYLELANLENTAGQSEKVLEHASKAIQISPGSFPIAYLLNGWANLRMRRYDEAAKSALEGLKLDDEHRFPDFEFVAGMALLGKRDLEGAGARLKAYLALAPLGANAALAQRQLATLRSSH
jgi:tetratricopeptide (TPR) repeat protein